MASGGDKCGQRARRVEVSARSQGSGRPKRRRANEFGPWSVELDDHAAVGGEGEAVFGAGRSRRVADESLEGGPIFGPLDDDGANAGVEGSG